MNLCQVTTARQAEEDPGYVAQMFRFCAGLIGGFVWNATDGRNRKIINVCVIDKCVYLVKGN